MNKKYIVKQNSYKDCGPSCLLSIMKYYGCEASHEEVTYLLKMDREGTNAYNIINGSRSFGFDGYGIHYTYDEIVNNNVNFPFICHVIKDNYYHFIVVYGIKKDKLIIMDPSSNKYNMSFKEFEKIYLKTAIVIYPTKKISGTIYSNKLIDFIKENSKLEKNNIIKSSILSLIFIMLNLLCNIFSLLLLDIVLPNYKYSLLLAISISFGLIYFIKNLINYFRCKLLIKINKKISLNININILRKFFNLPYQFFKNKSTGEVLSRFNDIKILQDTISEIILNFSTDFIMVIMSIIVLLFINYQLFLINLVSIIIYYLIVILYKKAFDIKTEETLIAEGEYQKKLNENICSYETNKNLNMISQSIKDIEISYIKYQNKLKLYEKILNKQIFLKNILTDITYIISISFGVIFIKNSSITLGEFFMFNSIICYFTEPIKNIFDLSPNINYIKNIYKRINDLLLIQENNENGYNLKLYGDIEIKNLSYSYNGLNNIIKNISFKIPNKSKFLIYGDSGNGKSTIIKIILKYLKDYDGNILIGNKNIKDIDISSIAYSFSYASQNSYIYNDTLMNNIICNRNISMDLYEKIIDICHLNKLRDKNKLRNNFMIEDNGFNISGGERQKIILARCLLKNSNYIILDESLSEVDVFEEKEILNNIFNYFNDKTIICISHKEEIINMFSEKIKVERMCEVC